MRSVSRLLAPRWRGRWHAAAIAVAIAIASPSPLAQHSLRFAHLSVDDGLSQSSVENIIQDRRGMLWFGTQEGLNRYDGYRFTVHRAREQEGFLRDHAITGLVADPDGDLWVGTSRGLYRYDLDTGRFESSAPPVNDLGVTLRTLTVSGDGRIFFAADGRLWVLDRATADRRARQLSTGVFSPITGVTAVAPADGTAVWVAAQGRLFKVDAGAHEHDGRVDEVLHDLGNVSVIARDRRGDVWIGRSDGGLLRYRPRDHATEPFPQAPRQILAVLPVSSGEIWIGARRGGVSRLDPSAGTIATYRRDPDDPESLLSDDVASIYEDTVGNLWIGSWNGGVDRFDPLAQAFHTFRPRPRTPDSLPVSDVTEIDEAPDGMLWLASRSGLLMTGDPRSGTFRTVATLPPRGGLFGVGWWDGRVLLGTAEGLVVFDARSGRELPLDAALQAHGLGQRPIAAVRSARDSAWIAAGKHVMRVTRTRAGPWAVERLALPIEGAAFSLSIARHGRIWIGTDSGDVLHAAWKDDASRATVVPLQLDPAARDSLIARRPISSLHEDRRGNIWVATRRGLGRIDVASGRVSWLGDTDGLPSTDISGITGGADGMVWLSHNSGLTRIDPATGAMTHFGGREGAQGKGYVESGWAAGASGTLYFAGDGITAFDPRQVRTSSSPPRIVFTGLEVLHRQVVPSWLDPESPLQRAIEAQEEVTLGPDATVFSIEMTALHYADPPSNRLQYRLEGFDPEWIETGAHNRIATYTNLAPGRYVLRARAGTKNGVWSAREATLAIRILPPWWRTNAAIAGWIAVSLLAVSLLLVEGRRRARVKTALLERETLRRESITDPLTGLHNRRFLITYMQHEVPGVLREYRARGPAAAESGDDLLLLLVDVDYFKPINDRYSHAAGDRVLTTIAAALREHIRDSDLAVRWGGDEFLIVTRGFRRASAAEYAERLRAAIAARGRTLADAGDPACTVSIGFAAFPFLPHEPDALTWEKTLDLADHALRLTKARGRNSYTGLISNPGLSAAAVTRFLDGGDLPAPAGLGLAMPVEA